MRVACDPPLVVETGEPFPLGAGAKRQSSGSFWTLCSVAYAVTRVLTAASPSTHTALILTKGSHLSGRASSGKIASTGHSGSQAPQSMHSSGSITSIRSVSWMQSTGQTSMQERSLMSMHGSEITYVMARDLNG